MSFFGLPLGPVELPRYAPMFEERTETITQEDRATLALSFGGPILGLPRDCSPDERTEATEALRAWHAGNPDPLALPWPVDVVDLSR